MEARLFFIEHYLETSGQRLPIPISVTIVRTRPTAPASSPALLDCFSDELSSSALAREQFAALSSTLAELEGVPPVGSVRLLCA